MSIYRYAENSAIKEAIFHHTKNRPPVALLAAAQHASPDQLSAVRLALDAAGWQSVPAYAEGRAVLQVSGFKQESELNNLLRAHRFTEGKASIIGRPGDEPKLSPGERLRHMGLKLAGFFNLIGNTGMVIDGFKKRDPYRITGGSLLTLGAANLVRYGNAKSDHYQRELEEDLAGFIRNQGVTPPPDSRLLGIMQHKRTGLLAKAENFLYRYPAQVTLGVDSVGATALLASGIKKIRGKEGWGALGFGIGSVGLKLTSMLVPEKSKDEIKQNKSEKRNLIEKVKDWIQEKPLRFYGFGSLISDAFLWRDAYEQYKREPGKLGYIRTAVSSACYTLADIMYSISSKDHVNDDGKFTADEQRGIEALAAESLAQQPEPSRGTMAQKLGSFLEKHKEVRGNAGSISQSIIEQARHMRDNPWVIRTAGDEPYAAAR